MKLTKSQLQQLRNEISRIPETTRDEFQIAFAAWKKSWDAPHVSALSDPSCTRFCPEYARLIALGDRVIPLVIEKLLDPDNFLALQLYDALQSSPAAIVSVDSTDQALLLEGEQGRATRTVECFFANR